MNIKTYNNEKDVVEQVLKNTSIAYCTSVDVDNTNNETIKSKGIDLANKLSVGSIKDEDLFFHKSILVSTVWNKNDDVFVPEQVWAARHTPEDKPSNLNHDDSIIVGHIVNNIVIDENNKIIADNVKLEDLPDKFHILTSSVIYQVYHNDECQARANKLIEEIKTGKKYVSMECIFTDFDYALKYTDGSIKFVKREESTAHLTGYLRAYGGSGEFNGIKLGRVIKNLYFSGKGYVDKPANPESVIFTKTGLTPFLQSSIDDKIEVLNEDGVLCSNAEDKSESSDNILENQKKVINMADNILEKQNDELKDEVSSLKAKIGELTDKLARADISKYEAEISDLKAKLQDQKDEFSKVESKVEDLAGKLKESEETCNTLAKEKEELQSSLAKMEDEKIRTARISNLIDGGVDKEVATKKVELFSNLNDEQFESVATEIINAHTKQEVDEADTEDIEVDKAESKVEEVDLDSVITPTEPDLAAADTSDEDEKELRDDLVALASQFSPIKKENE